MATADRVLSINEVPNSMNIASPFQWPCRVAGLLSMSFGICLTLSRTTVAAGAERTQPNFVIIMVDDMGYEGVSCFGNPSFQTPEIDRLAAEGMRLTDFHSSGTVCSPTRAGLLTGRYQQRAGIEAVIHPRG